MHERDLYLNEWQGGDSRQLTKAFSLRGDLDPGIEVLLASYIKSALCGEAFVLFKQAGKLFEVNASHDSVDSMADQWEPEETMVAALRYRLEKGRLGRDDNGQSVFAAELAFLIAELEAEGYR